MDGPLRDSKFLMKLNIPELCSSGILVLLNNDKISELGNSEILL